MTQTYMAVITILLALAGPQDSEPVLSLTVNETGRATAFRGDPLIFSVHLLHPAAFDSKSQTDPIVLDAKDGRWSNHLRIIIEDADGKPVTWKLESGEQGKGELKLEATGEAVAVFWMTTADLPKGTYRVRAELTDPAAKSTPVRVELKEKTESQNRDEFLRQKLLLARYHALRGDRDRSKKQIDELLTKLKDSPAGLATRGDLLLGEGKTKEALKSYDLAIRSHRRKNPNSREPPFALLAKRRAARIRLSGDKK